MSNTPVLWKPADLMMSGMDVNSMDAGQKGLWDGWTTAWPTREMRKGQGACSHGQGACSHGQGAEIGRASWRERG